MGSCSCSRLEEGSWTEMAVLSDILGYDQNLPKTNSDTGKVFYPDVNRLYKHHSQIKTKKTEHIEAKFGLKRPTRLKRQHSADNRMLYPTKHHVRMEDSNSKMRVDPQSSQTKEQFMDISVANVDCDIATVLARLMASEDQEIKALAKRLLTEIELRAASTVRNVQKSRTCYLTSPEQLMLPYFCYPFDGHIDREYRKARPPPDDDIDDDYSLESSPSLHYDDDEWQSIKNFERLSSTQKSSEGKKSEIILPVLQTERETQEVLEYSKLYLEKSIRKSAIFCEKLKNMPSFSETLTNISFGKKEMVSKRCETSNNSIVSITESSLDREAETVLQAFEHDFPDFPEEEFGMISRDIDKFEHKINETQTRIRQLRWESVIMLTKVSNPKNNSETDRVTETPGYLEIEKKISLLEDESHELKIKRREALSNLQNKILENILGLEQKELLPLVPIPRPKRISASRFCDPQSPPTSFEMFPNGNCQFSSLSKSSEAEPSDIEESSTQKEDINHTEEEKPNEN